MAEQRKRRGILAGVVAFLAVAAVTTGAGALRPAESDATPVSPLAAVSAPSGPAPSVSEAPVEPTTTTAPAPVTLEPPAPTTPAPATAPPAGPSTPTTARPAPVTTTPTTSRPTTTTTRPPTTQPATTQPATTTVKPPSTPAGVTAFPSILALAQAEVGGPEARYTAEWGFSRNFWCAKFVSWILAHAGVDIRDDGPADLKWKVEAVTDPRPGDLVFIDLAVEQGSGQTNHVGIVEEVLPDGRVATIEGNGPDELLVGRSVRAPAEITGYGRAPAPTLTSLVVPPAAPDCIWVEIGKPWMCD